MSFEFIEMVRIDIVEHFPLDVLFILFNINKRLKKLDNKFETKRLEYQLRQRQWLLNAL